MKTPLTPRTLDLFKQKGNGTLDLIAPEVFYQIMVFLQPKDIQTCMCVSKKWKLLLSTSYFWRNYMNHSFDFDDDENEELTGILHELGSEWFFGWGHGTVQALSEGELFEEFPKRWKCGIVHPAVGSDVRGNVDDYKAMYEALYQLQKLRGEVYEREIVYTGSCENRGECPIDVTLFPWDHDKLPSQEEVIEIFHFNTNLQLDVRFERSEKSFAEDKKLESMFKCRRQLPDESSFFEILPKVVEGYVQVSVDYQGRSRTYRPCPVFILTQLSPGWCGGVLTGVW